MHSATGSILNIAKHLMTGIRYRLSELFARRTWAPYMVLFVGTVLLVLVGAVFHAERRS
jgi:hypothetical protein